MVFISLPVANLPSSISFYQSIGLSLKVAFPDGGGAWMFLSENFSVMLITHSKWKEFTSRTIPDARKTAQFGLTVTTESKGTVDAIVEKGAMAGGKLDPNPIEDHGFMYGRSLEDPDGHILEFKWMDFSAMPSA